MFVSNSVSLGKICSVSTLSFSSKKKIAPVSAPNLGWLSKLQFAPFERSLRPGKSNTKVCGFCWDDRRQKQSHINSHTIGFVVCTKNWKTTPSTVARPVCTVVTWDCWQWRFFWWCHLQSVNMFDGELACNLLFGGIYTLTLINLKWIPSKICIFCGFWFRP